MPATSTRSPPRIDTRATEEVPWAMIGAVPRPSRRSARTPGPVSRRTPRPRPGCHRRAESRRRTGSRADSERQGREAARALSRGRSPALRDGVEDGLGLAPGSGGSSRAASSWSEPGRRLDIGNARATTRSSATRGWASRYSTALPVRFEVTTPVRRSTARCWDSCEASQPVTSSSRVTGAPSSPAAARTSRTWIRVGCARHLNRSALIR